MCIFAITQAQYILIHQALLEHNQFGETEIPLSELHSTLSTLRSKVPPSEVSLMEEEFEVLMTRCNERRLSVFAAVQSHQKSTFILKDGCLRARRSVLSLRFLFLHLSLSLS